MKIVMICDLFLDNLNYQENLLAKYYVKAGHEVVIIASTFDSIFDYVNDNYSHKESTVSNFFGIKIIKLPYSLNFLNKIRRFGGVLNILKEERPNLIFLHGIHFNLREAIHYKTKINSSCKVIFDYHGDFSNSGKNWVSIQILHKIIRKRFLYLYLNKVDKIFYVTPSSAKFLNQIYSISYDKMSLLCLGADVDLISEKKANNIRFQLREKLLIHENDFVIFTGGKLTPSKKTELIIKAFLELNDERAYLLIIGDSSENNLGYKKELINLANNNNKIHFIGWLSSDEVYDYMIASDISVFPSSQSVLWQQSICSELPLIVGLDKGQEINYLNKYNVIQSIEQNQINHNSFYLSILPFLNIDYLNKKKLAAKKTRDEFLDYNKIISKTFF